MTDRLEGKTAAITGGTSGIGLAAAMAFAEQGASVAVLARTQEKADETAAAIGHGAIAVIGDVTDLASLEAFFAEVAGRLGRIDIVLSSAGISTPGAIAQKDEAAFDHEVAVNFKGAYFTVKYAMPHLNRGASVVLVSSCLNEMGMAGLSVYSGTKAAVRSLARSLTPELGAIGARINVLSPGPIETDIEKKAGMTDEEVEVHRSALSDKLAAGRMGRPAEMAAVALFLASDDSSYLFGSEIQADGGMNQTRWVS